MQNSVRYLPLTYFFLSIVILGIYGSQVYPYFTKPLGWSLFALAMPYATAAVLQVVLERRLVETGDMLLRLRRQFLVSLGVYLLVAAGCAVSLGVLLGEPWAVVIKVLFGVLFLGVFASIDHTLSREIHRCDEPDWPSKLQISMAPVSARLRMFLPLLVVIAMGVTAGAAYTDLIWLEASMDIPRDTRQQIFLIDVFFVFGVTIIMTLRLIHAYSNYLQRLFDAQLETLKRVADGDLKQYLPVLSRDEFGLVASRINSMIDSLREKDRLRLTLERIVSPSIMEKLLTTDDKTLKYGQEYDVAIVFCDLREFTKFTETATAEDVIFFLNAYFSQMTTIVTEHSGIINKFMGDAILAVFGLEGGRNAVEDATATSWAILAHAQAIRMPDGSHINIGIGIHSGSVVAGTIGSEERYEYTFIGDAVNTASRLDGLSKRLRYSIVISEDSYNQLGEEAREPFVDMGAQILRGKSEPVHVYAAGAFPEDA